MLLDVLECITYILAVYGLLILVSGIAGLIRCRIKGRRPMVRVVIFVRNAEEQIEYIVRSAVKKEYAAMALSDKKLAVVDMDSSDNTFLLLERLSRNFPSIEIMKADRIDEILNEFRETQAE